MTASIRAPLSAVCMLIVLIAAPCGLHAQGVKTFGGFYCGDDCSGHARGYDWAERRGLTDEDQCRGQSDAFIEGCRAYIEDPYRGSDEDDDGVAIDR